MVVLKNILVATDFGPASAAALTYGRALARHFGARLHLLHVAENDFLRPSVTDPLARRAAVGRQLDELITSEDQVDRGARTALEISDRPAETITGYAKHSPIDLIVMGTHGHTGLTHVLMGSVAERVVRTAPCPVLTVRHPEHEFVLPDAAPAVHGMRLIALKKVLVATDFSDASDAALAYGRELAHRFGAALTVVHVVDDVMVRAYGVDSGLVLTDPNVQRQIEADARTRIDAAISDEDRVQLKASAVVLMATAPSSAIVTYAHESGIDLIVMGTHGRGGLRHLLMGSVSERVVQTAPCPVLTVRHPEREFVVPDTLVAVTNA